MTFSAFNFFWARKLPAMTVSTSEYEPLTSELLETEGSVPFVHEKQTGSHIKRSTWSSPGVILFQAMFLLALVFFAIVTVTTSRRGSCSASDELCTRHMSAYSPLIEANAFSYEWRMFDADFDQHSVYRGTPNPERDAAWKQLWDRGAINIPADKLASLNKSDGVERLQTPPEKGGGTAAILEFHHLLHCVDALRRWTYRDEYRRPDGSLPDDYIESPGNLVRTHLDHCLEMLRIHITCAADVTPVLLPLDPHKPQGYIANFHTLHKCRDIEAINLWTEEHNAIE